ncbi:MAG TPA: TonB-dependent receptor [Chitinophagaceae bacterium]|nr:TonB-dependent receptor [Chitinophagaceae bacterium]
MLLCYFVPCMARAGIIKGHVYDMQTGTPLTGASIRLEKTGLHGISGLDGSYRIKDVPAGTYRLVISYVSYQPFVAEVKISGQGTIIVNAFLGPGTKNQLQEITVRAAAAGSLDNSIRRTIRYAPQIMNIVSAHDIQISPDLTVANVVQRVSGVSLERNTTGNGQFAIIRGMDKRYNYTMVNGIKMPSPDNGYRYVPLDIFPSGLLSTLEVYKTLTPSMEGDAVGGVVNMVMKEAPERFTLTANLATGYSALFLNKRFMGFDHRHINKLSPYQLQGNQYNATPMDFSKASLDYTLRHPPPDLRGGFSIGDRFLHHKLGVILAGSIQNTSRGNNSLFFDSEVVDTLKGVTLSSMHQRKYSERQLRYGLYANMDYRINENSKLQWYNSLMKLTDIQVRDDKTTLLTIGGYDPGKGDATLEYSTRSRLTKQKIYNSTLQGDHRLLNNLALKWAAVYSIAVKDQPDNTLISLNGEQKNAVSKRTTIRNLSRRWEHNSDRDVAGYFNMIYNKPVAGVPIEWTAGGLYRDKHRHNFYNEYYFLPEDPFATFGDDFDGYTQIRWSVENPRGSVATSLNYDASEKTTAGFLQFKISGKKLEITGGGRVEHVNQGYRMRFPIGEDLPIGKQLHTDFLPSLHIKYSPAKRSDFRISYFRSVNRPGFFEIVPYTIVNEEYVEKGNPHLKEALADNLDFRYAFYPASGGHFMAGIFYKHLKDPIEYTLEPDSIRGQDIYYTPGNFGNATNFGGEIDFIRYFNKIGIKANYTYTHSRITTAKSKRVRDENGDLETIAVNETRPLYHQPTHIANLSLLYKDPETGWGGQLAGAYTGKRINTVSQFVDNDLWQKGFVQMDASVEKKFKNGISIFAKFNNLLNSPMTLYINNNSFKNAAVPYQDLSGKTLIRHDIYQRSAVVGLRFTPK